MEPPHTTDLAGPRRPGDTFGQAGWSRPEPARTHEASTKSGSLGMRLLFLAAVALVLIVILLSLAGHA